MGSRGPIGKAQGHRRQAKVVELVHQRPDPPLPPEGLTERVIEAWHRYWDDDVSQAATPSCWPAINRLFELYTRLERAWTIVDRALAVKGSRGQIRTNPIARHAMELEALVLRLESELGMTPMARARLGLAIGQGQLTVEQINQMTRRSGHTSIKPALAEGWEPAE